VELADVLVIIAANEDELRRRHVATLSVYGSVARGEARPDSDVDLIVEFDGSPVGLFDLVELREFLTGILGRPVDLVTNKSVKRQLRAKVFSEAVRAA
jgi:predicted nucleotidyltransferase